MRNATIEDRSSFQKGDLFSYFLITENHIYLHTSQIDCVNRSFYAFTEKIGNLNFTIWVDSESVQSERYFDLKDLKVVVRSQEPMICDDWYWLKARFDVLGSDLKLGKVSSFYDNSYSEESFYAKEDSVFCGKL